MTWNSRLAVLWFVLGAGEERKEKVGGRGHLNYFGQKFFGVGCIHAVFPSWLEHCGPVVFHDGCWGIVDGLGTLVGRWNGLRIGLEVVTSKFDKEPQP